MTSGWNPLTGRDASGTRPNFAPAGAPVPGAGQPYIPHSGGPGYSFGTYSPYNPFPASAYAYPSQGTQGYPYAGYPPQPQAQQAFAWQPNGAGSAFLRQPQGYPTIDPEMPAAQMTNASGGLGCEPGYNYFFPAKHTKVHVFRSTTAPWQLPAQTQLQFKASYIPINTTCAELLKGFGSNNPSAKKNRCYELVAGGGGKWYKGIGIAGDDKDMMKKRLADLGWDETRTGAPDAKPVVCLWFCKD